MQIRCAAFVLSSAEHNGRTFYLRVDQHNTAPIALMVRKEEVHVWEQVLLAGELPCINNRGNEVKDPCMGKERVICMLLHADLKDRSDYFEHSESQCP